MADIDPEQKYAASRVNLETLDRGALIEIVLTQRVVIEELLAVQALFEMQNKDLRARMEDLEAKVRRNSMNAHPLSYPPGMGNGLFD